MNRMIAKVELSDSCGVPHRALKTTEKTKV